MPMRIRMIFLSIPTSATWPYGYNSAPSAENPADGDQDMRDTRKTVSSFVVYKWNPYFPGGTRLQDLPECGWHDRISGGDLFGRRDISEFCKSGPGARARRA